MFRILIAPITVLLYANAAAAQEPLSPAQAVALALASNPAVRVADAAAKEADARLAQARSGYLPRVNVVESWQRGDQPVFVFGSRLSQRRFRAQDFALEALNQPAALASFKTLFAVEQPLFDGARTPAGISAARRGQTIAALERTRLVADLALAATRAYGQVLAAQAGRRAAEAAVAAAEEDLRRAARRRDAGLETDAYVLALNVHLAEMRERQIRSVSDETVARTELNQTMGVELDRHYVLVDVPPSDETTALDLPTLEAAAVAARPELKQADAQRELALDNRKQARAALLPQVSLQAGVELNGGAFADRASAWIVGTQVAWNVFSGGASQARLREATSTVARARAERDRLEAAVRVEVRSAVARVDAARARADVGRAAVEQARESQRIIRDRYEAGLSPASELLRANQALLDADALRTGAVVDLLVSRAALDRAVGKQE